MNLLEIVLAVPVVIVHNVLWGRLVLQAIWKTNTSTNQAVKNDGDLRHLVQMSLNSALKAIYYWLGFKMLGKGYGILFQTPNKDDGFSVKRLQVDFWFACAVLFILYVVLWIFA